jgi:hypothetical protein
MAKIITSEGTHDGTLNSDDSIGLTNVLPVSFTAAQRASMGTVLRSLSLMLDGTNERGFSRQDIIRLLEIDARMLTRLAAQL